MSRSDAYDARNQAFQQAYVSIPDAKAASIPTAKIIPALCQELGLPAHVEDVPNGAGGKLHWMGNRSAKKIILYVHGKFILILTSCFVDL